MLARSMPRWCLFSSMAESMQPTEPRRLAEYAILREVVVELAARSLTPALRSAEMPRLHAAIDLAVGESVRQYMGARERTLRALNLISEAALDQADVVVFLNKLLAVLCET